jgi:hypothetical protein
MPIISRLTGMAGQPRRWRYRVRTLLVAVLATGFFLGWLELHLRREMEQVALMAELNLAQIFAYDHEPNFVGWMIQALPTSAKRAQPPLPWMFGYSPTRILVLSITDSQVEYLIEKMRRLPNLRSVNFCHDQLSPEAEEIIRKAMPGVHVVVDHWRTPSEGRVGPGVPSKM